MLRYIIKRLLALIPIILIMSMIVFGLTELASGDPARILAEMTYEHPTNEQVEWTGLQVLISISKKPYFMRLPKF